MTCLSEPSAQLIALYYLRHNKFSVQVSQSKHSAASHSDSEESTAITDEGREIKGTQAHLV